MIYTQIKCGSKTTFLKFCETQVPFSQCWEFALWVLERIARFLWAKKRKSLFCKDLRDRRATGRDVNVSFFCEQTFCFFGPLEKKFILFRFRFWNQRKAKICLLIINKKFVFILKCFFMFYSLKRTKYSLIFYWHKDIFIS